MVDGVGQIRVEIAERIVGERREMNDGVEAFKIVGERVARVLGDGRERRNDAARVIGATPVEVDVIAGDVMPGGAQKRRHDRADITRMACKKHLHALILIG